MPLAAVSKKSPAPMTKSTETMAAFWNVFIDPHVKATFKIELDQIFPQQTLVEQTGATALEFVGGENSALKRQYNIERRGWNVYYDTLDAVEQALKNKDRFALGLQQKAKAIVRQGAVRKKLKA